MSLAKSLLTAFAAPSLAATASAQFRSATITGAVTNAPDPQVIHDVPKVTQNPLFYSMLRNGVQPRSETSTSTYRRSINDRQSVSAN
jgi:trimeric autotransporter adhesin